jgi:acyl-CoA dehydrogenase
MPLSGLEPISPAFGLDHYSLDRPYRSLLKYYLKEDPDYSSLGRYAGSTVYETAYRVDLLSPPLLVNWSVLGENPDVSLLDPMEKQVLLDLILKHRVNTHPFEGRSWHHHYTGLYLIGDPGISCILTITIQTAYALYKYGGGLRDYYKPLAGIQEPPMWGATWFTEVQGGSDLGANTTVAERRGETWVLNGYKYFASGAGLASMALTTARPVGGKPGAKGLGLFLVSRKRSSGKLNYRVRRLKWKSGTIAVPTGEVEFIDTEAYLLGDLEKGIYYTMEDLMVSRLANAHAANGIARKAYLEAYGYAATRKAFGGLIRDHPLLARDLLEMELLIEAGLSVSMKAITLFDEAWHDEPPYSGKYHYARLMTHVAKNYTADIASTVTRRAMEIYGGIGFLHEYPVERWHREALITPIWEGTSNIQALDMLEAMWKKNAHQFLLEDMEELTRNQENTSLAEEAYSRLEDTVKKLEANPGLAEWMSKEALTRIAESTAVLLLLDAARQTGDTILEDVAELYYNWSVKHDLIQPEKTVLEEITSLRGSLLEVDWERKARI